MGLRVFLPLIVCLLLAPWFGVPGFAASGPVGFLTDLEGKHAKLTAWTEKDQAVLFRDPEGRLQLREGATMIFGGDYVDHGPGAMRLVEELLDLKARYGERIVILLGNRDLNKLRLQEELGALAMAHFPSDFEGWLFAHFRGLKHVGRSGLGNYNTPVNRLRWILERTMNAPQAFENRRMELSRLVPAASPVSEEAVLKSFLDDLGPEGAMRKLLLQGQLAFRGGSTLAVHGAITSANFGVVPGQNTRLTRVDDWVKALNEWYRARIQAWAADPDPSRGSSAVQELIRYQGPLPGSRLNDESVVFARYSDASGNPVAPSATLATNLREQGIRWVVTGHTPQADTPSLLRENGVTFVLADNTEAEHPSTVVISEDGKAISVRSEARVPGGTRGVEIRLGADEESPLGKRISGTRLLVKARLDDGQWLLTEVLPEYQVRSVVMPEAEFALKTLVSASTAGHADSGRLRCVSDRILELIRRAPSAMLPK